MRTIRDLLAAFLFGLLLLWATTCHACGFGYSASYVAAYNYAPQVAYVQAYAVAVPQVAYVAAAAPCVQTEAAVVATPYAAPLAMPYAQTLGVSSYGVGFNSFAANSYGYGSAFVGRRAFFRSDVAVVGSGVNVNVFSGRRGFFARDRGVRSASVVTRSVTRTRTRIRRPCLTRRSDGGIVWASLHASLPGFGPGQ